MKISHSMRAVIQKMIDLGHGIPEYILFLRKLSPSQTTYHVTGYSNLNRSAYTVHATVTLEGFEVKQVEIDPMLTDTLISPVRPGLRRRVVRY